MKTKFLTGFAACLALLLAACGGSNNNDGSSPTEPSAEGGPLSESSNLAAGGIVSGKCVGEPNNAYPEPSGSPGNVIVEGAQPYGSAGARTSDGTVSEHCDLTVTFPAVAPLVDTVWAIYSPHGAVYKGSGAVNTNNSTQLYVISSNGDQILVWKGDDGSIPPPAIQSIPYSFSGNWQNVSGIRFVSETSGTLSGCSPDPKCSITVQNYITNIGASADVPKIKFTASPTSVRSGEKSVLSWSVPNAALCSASDGWSGEKEISGVQETSPLSSATRFTLTCTNPKGSASASVNVGIFLPQINVSASPNPIFTGASSMLTWTALYVTSCTASGGTGADGWSGPKPTSGSFSIASINPPQTYTLTCGDGTNVVSRSVGIDVVPRSGEITIVASPNTIASGSSTSITWSTSGSGISSCHPLWSGGGPISGDTQYFTNGTFDTGPLTSPRTYNIQCSNGSTLFYGSATVNVTGPTLSLTASPNLVVTGSASTLTWSATNVDFCEASGDWSGTQPLAGTYGAVPLVFPHKKTYSLVCNGTQGSVSQSVTVDVKCESGKVCLAADTAVINSGESANIFWDNQSGYDATTCRANWPSPGAAGAWPTPPDVTYSYYDYGGLPMTGTSGSWNTGPLTATQGYQIKCNFVSSPIITIVVQ